MLARRWWNASIRWLRRVAQRLAILTKPHLSLQWHHDSPQLPRTLWPQHIFCLPKIEPCRVPICPRHLTFAPTSLTQAQPLGGTDGNFFCHGGLAARDEAGQEQESVRRVASDHILHDHTYIYIYAPHHRRNPGREGGSAVRVYPKHPEIPVATLTDPRAPSSSWRFRIPPFHCPSFPSWRSLSCGSLSRGSLVLSGGFLGLLYLEGAPIDL